MASKTQLILICDMQTKFRDAICQFEKIESCICCLLDLCNVLQFPIIVTTQNSDKLGQTIPSIADRLPTGTLCHDKSLFSMLEEEVVRDINQINPDRIVLVGIEAQICISQTALALRDGGYSVTVLADAVSSSSSWERDLALQRLMNRGIDVNSLESWLFESTNSSEHHRFRDLSRLIKGYKKEKQEVPKASL